MKTTLIKHYCVGFIIGLFIGLIIDYIYYKQHPKEIIIPTPVEKEVIDTLYFTRDSLIYRTEYLEEIKHDTIKKIYALDDSATYILFIKLVSEK